MEADNVGRSDLESATTWDKFPSRTARGRHRQRSCGPVTSTMRILTARRMGIDGMEKEVAIASTPDEVRGIRRSQFFPSAMSTPS